MKILAGLTGDGGCELSPASDINRLTINLTITWREFQLSSQPRLKIPVRIEKLAVSFPARVNGLKETEIHLIRIEIFRLVAEN